MVIGKERFTLRQAVADTGATLVGKAIWKSTGAGRCTRSSSTTWGRFRTTHQSAKQAKLVGRRKAESYYFPPQHNNVGNNFPYTFMGFEPGTAGAGSEMPRRLEQGRQRHSRPLQGLPPEAPEPDGSSTRASSTPRAASAPTSRSGEVTCSACTRAWSRDAMSPGACS